VNRFGANATLTTDFPAPTVVNNGLSALVLKSTPSADHVTVTGLSPSTVPESTMRSPGLYLDRVLARDTEGITTAGTTSITVEADADCPEEVPKTVNCRLIGWCMALRSTTSVAALGVSTARSHGEPKSGEICEQTHVSCRHAAPHKGSSRSEVLPASMTTVVAETALRPPLTATTTPAGATVTPT
jgi:hypothetical protein